jgi:thiosulfate dehydrogenase (quinone) large subunit
MSVQDRTSPARKSNFPSRKTMKSSTLGDTTFRRSGTSGAKVLAVLRIVMGLMFLWAFLDKAFGWGYATGSAQAWIKGGSPTKGFLSHVQVGPLQSTLRGWGGTGWADWLFMIALLGIGLALLFGIGMRLAAVAGTILLASMWMAEWPPAQHTSGGAATSSTNPLIDYHLVYIVVVIALAIYAAGDTWGFGRQWTRLNLVRKYRWLS